jgi:DNA-binding IscR family transcriptional regulator
MAEQLRVPLRLVGQITSKLVKAGLILDVVGVENACAPGRPLEQITVWDILEALRTGKEQELATSEDAAREIVMAEFEAVEQTWRQAADSLTLTDLVNRIRETAPPAAKELSPAH